MTARARTIRRWWAIELVWVCVFVVGCSGDPVTPTAPSDPVVLMPGGVPELSLSCPTDVAAATRVGTIVAVNFPLPIPSGNSIPVSVDCSPARGSTFAPGTTPVACSIQEGDKRTASCGFNVRVEAIPVLSITRFIAFGDSITAGQVSPAFRALEVPASYPFKLRSRLQSFFYDQVPEIVVANEGLDGEGAVNGPDRLTTLLAAGDYDALLLLEGSNDIGLGASVISDVVAALTDMVHQAQARGMRAFVATLPPIRAGSPKGGGAPFVPALNSLIAQLAVSEGATLVDLYAAFGSDTTGLIGQDGLHPTDQGHDLIADTFFDVLRQEVGIEAVLGAASPRFGPGRRWSPR